MNADEWAAAIRFAAWRAKRGHPERLSEIAKRLADMDTAKESLMAHGYGTDDDSLLACIDEVLTRERKGEAV